MDDVTCLLSEACDPLTPPGRLAELAEHRNLRLVRAVAGNPNTPRTSLVSLLSRTPEAVRHNAAWVLMVLADPSLQQGLLLQIARAGSDPEALDEAARDGDASVRRTLLTNKYLTPSLALSMLDDPDAEIVIYLLAAYDIEPDRRARALGHLARSTDPRGPLHAAGHPETPPAALAQLAQHTDERLLHRVAAHTSTPAEALASLARRPLASLRRAVARNPATSPDTLRALSSDHDLLTRAAVARHPATPPSCLEIMVHDSVLRVRCEAAQNPALPRAALTPLAKVGRGRLCFAARLALRDRAA